MNNSKEIIRNSVERSSKPLNKYNTSLHMSTEELADYPNDRTGYDCGTELEKHNQE